MGPTPAGARGPQGAGATNGARPSPQALKLGDVAKSLVSANELVDGCGLLNQESGRKLKGVEGVDLPRFAVPGNEVTGRLEVGVEDAHRGDDAIPDVVEKTEAEPVEVDVRDLSGPDLLRENGRSLGERQA